jgi:hypothetical protein
VGWIDWMTLTLIGVDQGCQHIEPVPFRDSRTGTPQPIYLREGGFVICSAFMISQSVMTLR